MRYSFSQLKGREVYTKSGVYLGKVRDVIFDIDTHRMTQFLVKKFPLWFFDGNKHLINHNQILKIEEDKIIVKDARIGDEKSKKSGTEATDPHPAMMMEEE